MRVVLKGAIALSILATGVAALSRLHSRHEERILFPGHDVCLYTYDDRPSGGASKVMALQSGPEGASWTFVMGAGPTSWAGLGGTLGSQAPGHAYGKDLRGWDRLDLDLWTSRPIALRCVLVGHDSALWRDGDELSHRYSESRRRDVHSGRLEVPLSEFQLADWWVNRGLVPESDTARKLENTVGFEIKVVPTTGDWTGSVDTLRVRRVALVAARARAGAWIWILPLLSWMATFALVLARRVRKAPDDPEHGQNPSSPPLAPDEQNLSHTSHPVRELAPAPVVLDDADLELRRRLLEYLEGHYARAELDADMVCREAGIPRSRLPDIVRDMGTTFKVLLNELRLKEATRLLRATENPVSEIAFAVGYGSIPHFNRVFRDRFGCTPQVFRATPMAPVEI